MPDPRSPNRLEADRNRTGRPPKVGTFRVGTSQNGVSGGPLLVRWRFGVPGDSGFQLNDLANPKNLGNVAGGVLRMGQLPRGCRALPLTAALIAIWLLAGPFTLRGDDFSRENQDFKRLTAPMTSILDGKTFRASLESIAAEASLNLWLDREVDPSVLVDSGPIGPTVFSAIEKLAAARSCTVMPVANVVLVGREAWVQRVAASILSLPASNRGDRIDVRWDDLTTPSEAWRMVAGRQVGDFGELPHDLWPAVEWSEIDREVAITLITGQFALESDTGIASSRQPQAFTRRYSLGIAPLTKIREVMKGSDSSSQVRVSNGWIVAKGSVAAHHAATLEVLRQVVDLPGPDPDADTFTLKKLTTPAENAIRQLAQAAGKTCIIKPEAVDACKVVVSIEGTDVTLRQLIDRVAQQAGVIANWQGETIEISLAP